MAAWALSVLLVVAAPDLDAELQHAVARSGADADILGVAVGRAGEAPFFTVRPDAPRAPASNMKLVTAAAAIQLLGPDFRFETTVARGPDDSLVVIGGGDPNLSGRFFDGDPNRILRLLAHDVASRGVATAPALLLDATRFDDEFVHPDWPTDQLDRWYCAPVAALVFNDSCWDVAVYPSGRAGAAARVEVQPSLLPPALANHCRTGDRQIVHIGRDAERRLEVRGEILPTSQGVQGHVTVLDPVLFFGRAFQAALAAEGVTVAGEPRRGTIADAKPLVVYRSSLARTLSVMLTNRQNLYAECVFKRLGEGSFQSAGQAALRALVAMGADPEGLEIRDGSGLAHTNRITARALYQVLQAQRDQPIFVDALATGGEGTLRRRFRDLGTRVRAKTGTIRGVSALSGYVTGREGGRYVFVVLGDGRGVSKARRLQDLVVQVLAGAP